MRFHHYPGSHYGAVAQLGERLVRNEKVSGSIPLGSTKFQRVRLHSRLTLFLLAPGVVKEALVFSTTALTPIPHMEYKARLI